MKKDVVMGVKPSANIKIQMFNLKFNCSLNLKKTLKYENLDTKSYSYKFTKTSLNSLTCLFQFLRFWFEKKVKIHSKHHFLKHFLINLKFFLALSKDHRFFNQDFKTP